VNEYKTGLLAVGGSDAVTTTGLPPGFSTVQGIDPSVKTRWNCYRTTYTGPPDAAWNLWMAFSRTFKRLHFQKMPKRSELGEGETFPKMIITSEEGSTYFEEGLVLKNDPLAAASNAKGDPSIMGLNYRNVPVEYLEEMTTGTFYVDAETGVSSGFVPEFVGSTDEDGNLLSALPNVSEPTARQGPRFGFIDNEYLRTFFKRGRMFRTTKVKVERQPWARVVVVDMWKNNFTRSPRRLGWVYPLDINSVKTSEL
jgi:hypothetical protein